ncbi:MAG: hypothetical protein HYU69_11150 [Bacteroidetes bacterium]|nr:hypothetical protein [Bacteroidota bacterium]
MWERKIWLSTNSPEINLQKLTEERKAILNKLHIIDNYCRVQDSLNSFYNKIGKPRNEREQVLLKAIIEDPLLRTTSNFQTFTSECIYYNIYGLYTSITGDLLNCFQSIVKTIELFEKYPRILELKLNHYTFSLSNHILYSIKLQRYEEANISIQKLKNIYHKLPPHKIDVKNKILCQIYTHETYFSLETASFKTGFLLIPKIEKQWANLYPDGRSLHKVKLMFNITLIFFCNSRYTQSLLWLNKILNESDKHNNRGLNNFCRILNLLIHYELGNYDLLEYEVKNTYRYFSKKEGLYLFEKALINFFNKISRNRNGQKSTEVFKALLHEISNVEKNSKENETLQYFDFFSWIESKIQNRSFAGIVREKTKLVGSNGS